MMQIVAEISGVTLLCCVCAFSSLFLGAGRSLPAAAAACTLHRASGFEIFSRTADFNGKIVIQIVPAACSCVPFSRTIISGILP